CPLRGAGGRGSGNLRSALHPFPVERLVIRISKHEICGIVEAAVEGVVEPVCIPTAMVALTYIAPGYVLTYGRAHHCPTSRRPSQPRQAQGCRGGPHPDFADRGRAAPDRERSSQGREEKAGPAADQQGERQPDAGDRTDRSL